MALAVQTSFEELGTPLSQVTFVVLDVETTGGSPATSSLTEVAAARYRGGELLATYQTLVRPDERIPPFITALTGISDAMVVDAPPIGAMLPSFLEFLGGAVVVGHNIRFDLGFLNHALVSTGRDPIANPSVDTLALARRLVRDMVPNCKLGTLAAVLRLPNQPSHRALNDVLATGDLLHALLERAGSYGIVGLEELLDLPRLVGHPQAAKLRLTTRLPHRARRLLVHRCGRARALCGQGHRHPVPGALVLHWGSAAEGRPPLAPALRHPPPGLSGSVHRVRAGGPHDPGLEPAVQPPGSGSTAAAVGGAGRAGRW